MWVFITQLRIFLDKIFQDESSDDEWCVHLATWQDETEEFCICPLIRITTSRWSTCISTTSWQRHRNTFQRYSWRTHLELLILVYSKGSCWFSRKVAFKNFAQDPQPSPGGPRASFHFFQDAGKQGKIMNHDVTKIYQPLMVIIYRVQRSSLIIFTPCIFTK